MLFSCILDGSFTSLNAAKTQEKQSFDLHLLLQWCATKDLGQNYDFVTTLQHYLQSSSHCLLYLGDIWDAENYLFYFQV
jgi:hypothetical protein